MATDIEVLTVASIVKSTTRIRQFQGVFRGVIEFKALLTEASIAAAKASQLSVTVPGAALGDFILCSIGGNATKIILAAQVTAVDTVKVTLLNADSTDPATDHSAGITAYFALLKPRSLSGWGT